MSKFDLSIENLERLIDKISMQNMEHLHLKCEGFELDIKGRSNAVVCSTQTPMAGVTEHFTSEKPAAVLPHGNVIKSPIVGTYYCAASPESEPFITIGKQVKEGDTLFIIESMKVMNEITSTYTGIVTSISVTDGEPVEYGQEILTIA